MSKITQEILEKACLLFRIEADLAQMPQYHLHWGGLTLTWHARRRISQPDLSADEYLEEQG
jgi:hypothetical protein